MGMYYEEMRKEIPAAKWLSDLDMENNSGAHLNAKSFVKDNGGYGSLDDVSMKEKGPVNLDIMGADKRGPM